MQHDFWLQRWHNGEIGFHQEYINPWLTYYYGELGPPQGQRAKLKVFVPLCGKSRDMLWLSQNGYQVQGIELSDTAVNDFFSESNLHPTIEEQASHTHYISEHISILQGDYFACTKHQLEGVTDVFDRASLIALPVSMREQYANKMTELLSAGTRMLLVTMTYPQHEMDGPPFSVSEEEVNVLFGDAFTIEKLAVKNTLDEEPRFKERGLSSLLETAYKLKRN